jgi:hydrophobe/amphiphile efflux-1 (HAE1) family protein
VFLTRAAVNNWVAVLMACLAILILSVIAVTRLPVDIFPEIAIPAIQVGTQYTGAIPESIERTVTFPIESSLARVNGVTRMQSNSTEGYSYVQVWLKWGSNMQTAMLQVLSNVERAMPGLPPGVLAPSVSQIDITAFPILQLSVSGGGLSPRKLDELAYFTLIPQLSRLPGVSTVDLYGGLVRQINVDCNPDKLAARGFSLADVENALSKNNSMLPSGNLVNNHLNYELKIPTLLKNVEEMRQVVLGVKNHTPVRIADVARVTDGTAPQSSIFSVDGNEAVGLFITMQPQANVIDVADAVRSALPKLTGVPSTVNVKIVFDQSIYVRTAVESLVHEGIIGAILVAVVVLVFLRNLKSLIIICVGIPLAVAAALLLLYFGGQTLNIFTLGGLTLALGRLVDDAIVVRENITRHLDDRAGRSVRRAVLDATHEVGMPVLASTVTTIAVLFPVIFLTGISQKLFVPFALSIGFSMAASYVVSMSVDPVMSIWLMSTRASEPGRVSRLLERAFALVESGYESGLRWTLRRNWVLFLGVAVMAAAAVWMYPHVGSEFFPESDESLIQVGVKTQQGTSVVATAVVTRQVEALVRTAVLPKELWAITAVSGSGAPNLANLSVRLVAPGERQRSAREIADACREALRDRFPGAQTWVSAGGLEKGVLNFGAGAPIDIQLMGYNAETGSALAENIKRLVMPVPGLTDVRVNPQGQVPSFSIQIDTQKAAMLGLNVADIARSINTALSGNLVAENKFIDPQSGNEFALVTELEQRYRSHPQDIGAIPVETLIPTANSDVHGSTPILLRQLATVSLSSTPVVIQRKNQQRMIDVLGNVDRPLGEVSAAIRALLDKYTFPEGFSYYLAGQTEQQAEAFKSMLLAAVLASMLVYAIMAAQFKSLTEPLVIMATVPLGLIGVVYMLWATGTTFNVMSFMGVIMMVGIVVSNGILLVEFANQLQERGQGLTEAMVNSCRTRLRPILMTALAAIVGMIPMATGWGGGSQTNEPLARAVIGGLTVSTFLTLLVIPLLYIAVLKRFPRQHIEVD